MFPWGPLERAKNHPWWAKGTPIPSQSTEFLFVSHVFIAEERKSGSTILGMEYYHDSSACLGSCSFLFLHTSKDRKSKNFTHEIIHFWYRNLFPQPSKFQQLKAHFQCQMSGNTMTMALIKSAAAWSPSRRCLWPWGGARSWGDEVWLLLLGGGEIFAP